VLQVATAKSAVGDLLEAAVVADDDHRSLPVDGDVAKQPSDVVADLGVEVGGGFVAQQHGRVAGERAGERDALPGCLYRQAVDASDRAQSEVRPARHLLGFAHAASATFSSGEPIDGAGQRDVPPTHRTTVAFADEWSAEPAISAAHWERR
jgi:hypothetical protein